MLDVAASVAAGLDHDEGQEPEQAEPGVPPAPTTDHARWTQAVDAVRQASPRHGKSLSFARFLGFTPEGARLAFAPDAAFHRSQVVGMSRALVEGELTKALGRPIKLVEDNDPKAFDGAPRSIAEVEASDRTTRERLIEAKVREHPATQAVLRHLGGAIEHVQVLEPAIERPLAPSAGEDPPDE